MRKTAAQHNSHSGSLVAILIWVLLWWLLSLSTNNAFILASPLQTVEALGKLLPTPAFWSEIAFSGSRFLAGTALGYLLGILCALSAWKYRTVRIFIEPLMTACKGAPLACLVVMLLIWFGATGVSVWAVFLMVTPAVYFSVLKGLDELDTSLGHLCRIMDVGPKTMICTYLIPGVLPFLIASSETILGMSWKAGVAAELIGIPDGSIGERIYQAKLLLETADVFAWTLVVVLVSWAFERIILKALRASWPALGHRAARKTPCASQKPARGALIAHRLVSGYSLTPQAQTFDICVQPGEALVLQGNSGAGKTTLIMTLANLLEPLEGTVENTGYLCAPLFQHSCLIEDLNAVENVMLFARVCSEQARSILLELLPDSALSAPVSQLSGGQRRRVELARALAAQGPLLLDEPFSGLDAASHNQALQAIKNHSRNRALVLSTHDPHDAEALGAAILHIQPNVFSPS